MIFGDRSPRVDFNFIGTAVVLHLLRKALPQRSLVLLVPLNVPGLVFVIPATTLFGTVPGIALSLCILSINLLGDAARDMLDPKLKKRAG